MEGNTAVACVALGFRPNRVTIDPVMMQWRTTYIANWHTCLNWFRTSWFLTAGLLLVSFLFTPWLELLMIPGT